MTELKLGCVVMAAGNASRFGKNKLAADFGGATLITRALRTIPKERFECITVVTQYDEIAALAKEFGFDVIYNRHPDWGISHTVALGTEAMQDCDAIMYQVSDQPLLRRESVEALCDLYCANSEKIVSCSHNGQRGNPCIFPARFFPELMALQGDKGGGAVIRRHEEDLLGCEVPAAELGDADTPEALEQLKKEQ